MCACFKVESNVAQNLINKFFSKFDCQKTLSWKGFYVEKSMGTGLLSEKTDILHVKLNERAEGANSSFSATVDFLQYIYLVLAATNH